MSIHTQCGRGGFRHVGQETVLPLTLRETEDFLSLGLRVPCWKMGEA